MFEKRRVCRHGVLLLLAAVLTLGAGLGQRDAAAKPAAESVRPDITLADGAVSANLTGVKAVDVLVELGRQGGFLVKHGKGAENLLASDSFEKVPLEEALRRLLRGSSYVISKNDQGRITKVILWESAAAAGMETAQASPRGESASRAVDERSPGGDRPDGAEKEPLLQVARNDAGGPGPAAPGGSGPVNREAAPPADSPPAGMPYTVSSSGAATPPPESPPAGVPYSGAGGGKAILPSATPPAGVPMSSGARSSHGSPFQGPGPGAPSLPAGPTPK